jgi:hypothetical protein
MYLWSDKDGSPDTCQSLTGLLILFVPSVRSITSFLLQTTKVGSLPWFRIVRLALTSQTSGGRSVGIVRWRTKAWSLFCCLLITLVNKVMAIGKKTSVLNYANSNKLIQNLDTNIFRHLTVFMWSYESIWLFLYFYLLNVLNISVQNNIKNYDVLINTILRFLNSVTGTNCIINDF